MKKLFLYVFLGLLFPYQAYGFELELWCKSTERHHTFSDFEKVEPPRIQKIKGDYHWKLTDERAISIDLPGLFLPMEDVQISDTSYYYSNSNPAHSISLDIDRTDGSAVLYQYWGDTFHYFTPMQCSTEKPKTIF